MSVGYEYESCLDLTLWEKRTAILQGYELDASNMGGWTLDKHHVLDVQNGKQLKLVLLISIFNCPALEVSHSHFSKLYFARLKEDLRCGLHIVNDSRFTLCIVILHPVDTQVLRISSNSVSLC